MIVYIFIILGLIKLPFRYKNIVVLQHHNDENFHLYFRFSSILIHVYIYTFFIYWFVVKIYFVLLQLFYFNAEILEMWAWWLLNENFFLKYVGVFKKMYMWSVRVGWSQFRSEFRPESWDLCTKTGQVVHPLRDAPSQQITNKITHVLYSRWKWGAGTGLLIILCWSRVPSVVCPI